MKTLDINSKLKKIQKVRNEWAKISLSTKRIDRPVFEKHMREFYEFSCKLCEYKESPLSFEYFPSPTGLFGLPLQNMGKGAVWHWQSVINSAIDSAMADQIKNLAELKTATNHFTFYEQIFNNAQDACTYFAYGSIANTPATYICARNIFGIKVPQEFDNLFNYYEKSLRLGGIWLVKAHGDGEKVTILYSERPTAVHTNENGFSCTTGPAIDWPDFKFYFIDGVKVPEKVVTNPENITIEMISNEKNSEVRRIMVEIMGYDKFLEKSEAEVLDVDTDIHNGTRALFQTVIGNLFHCACPTTGRTYWMRVPEAERWGSLAVTNCEEADKFLTGERLKNKKCVGAS